MPALALFISGCVSFYITSHIYCHGFLKVNILLTEKIFPRLSSVIQSLSHLIEITVYPFTLAAISSIMFLNLTTRGTSVPYICLRHTTSHAGLR